MDRRRGRKGIDQQHLRPEARGRPSRELTEVGEIADAPAPRRARRVELSGPSPDPQAVREMAAVRRDDEARRLIVVEPPQSMVAGRKVTGQAIRHPKDRAVLERELVRSVELLRRALPDDVHGWT